MVFREGTLHIPSSLAHRTTTPPNLGPPRSIYPDQSPYIGPSRYTRAYQIQLGGAPVSTVLLQLQLPWTCYLAELSTSASAEPFTLAFCIPRLRMGSSKYSTPTNILSARLLVQYITTFLDCGRHYKRSLNTIFQPTNTAFSRSFHGFLHSFIALSVSFSTWNTCLIAQALSTVWKRFRR